MPVSPEWAQEAASARNRAGINSMGELTVTTDITPDNVVIAECLGGLSNRIKCLLCALRVARATGRECLVYWDEDQYSRCPFSDVFSNRIRTIDHQTLIALKQRVPEPPQVVETWRWLVLPEDKIPAGFSRAYPSRTGHDIDFEYERIPISIRERYINLLRELRFPDRVLKDAEALSERLGDDAAGLHVRTWFEHAERAKVFSLQDVIRVIEQQPTRRFFLSCDSDEVGAHLERKYPERIVRRHPPRAQARNSTAGVHHALLDLYLLAQCPTLVTAPLSTFSEVAWWLGGCRAHRIQLPMKAHTVCVSILTEDVVAWCLLGRWTLQYYNPSLKPYLQLLARGSCKPGTAANSRVPTP